MTDFSDMAQTTKQLVGGATDFATMSLGQLQDIGGFMKTCTLAQSVLLADRCGGAERARREIALALDLPANVLIRRYQEAEKVIALDGLPSVQQIAAIIARTMATVRTIENEIARRGSVN